MTNRIFVPNQPAKFDNLAGVLVPLYDLSPALAFGELVDIFGLGSVELGPQALARHLKSKLAGFTADDYLLCIGDPVVIASASAIAARQAGGRITLLKYERRLREYFPVSIDIN